jgi:hypothetical protein
MCAAAYDAPLRFSKRRHEEGWDPVTSVGMSVAVAALLGVSGGMLWLIGYNYDGLAGSGVTKIHPFTYMIFILAAWRSFASGNPITYFARAIEKRPGAILMFFVAGVMFALTAIRKGPGLAGIIDTYMGPVLLVLLLAEAGERDLRRLTILLHLIMTANALLGLFEFASKTLIFPYRFDGEAFPTDTRSAGLQGHPLANAMLTAAYLMALLSGAREIPGGLRLVFILMQSAALVVFGGRTAMVISAVLGLPYVAWRVIGALRSGRVPLLGAAFSAVALTVVPIVIVAVVSSGMIDAILIRFSSDGGSANARAEMMGLFNYFSLRDLIFGPDLEYLETLRRINGLEWGIENPIVHMVLYSGALLTLAVFSSFGFFLFELTRYRGAGVALPMIAMLFLLNASESISVKTTFLGKAVIIFVCMFPVRRVGERGPIRLPFSGQALQQSPDRRRGFGRP